MNYKVNKKLANKLNEIIEYHKKDDNEYKLTRCFAAVGLQPSGS
jgi:hypothetical protein